IIQGLALPSTTGPWSAQELLFMADRINDGVLTEAGGDALEFVRRELGRTHGTFRAGGEINLEARGHGNPEQFIVREDYIRPWNLAKNPADLNFEGWITPYGYGLWTFSIGNSLYNKPVDRYNGGSLMAGSAYFGETAFSSNLPFIKPGTGDFSANFPVRGFASAGWAGRNSGFNLTVGRDRLSWGPGESGNLLVGSHIEYHDNGRLSFFNDKIKWTFSVSAFPYPDEYYRGTWTPPADPAPANPNHLERKWNLFYAIADPTGQAGTGDSDSFDGVNLFIAHRFEWRLFNRLNMALTEAIMYQDEEGYVNLAALSPFTFLHHLFRRFNSNSILSFEADWAPVPRLNLYSAVVADEFALPGVEPQPGLADRAKPNSFGWLLGAKTAFPLRLGKVLGMFTASLEGVWTSPYLYLRSSSGADAETENYKRGLDFVVANRYTFSEGVFYGEDFLGYRWGGDAIAINGRAGWDVYGKVRLGVNFLFLVHGTFDKYTVYNEVNVSKPPYNSTTPTGAHPNNGAASGDPSYQYASNYADPAAVGRDAVSYTQALSLSGSWTFWGALALYGEIDLVHVIHPRNYSSSPPATDLQWTLGLTYGF
ncbi:MAG: hypothetical protein LBQ61_06675, partial [Spirochaetales bacterium]|nr:hypothetical protein [Spirochaetales bacterium]